jgi:hypothetical protein
VEVTEASALLNLDVREAARVATACGAAAAREAVGVFALDDAVAFAVLSRRADLGAKKGT